MRLLLDTCIVYDWLMGTITHESLSIVTYDAIFQRYLANTLIVRH